MLGKYLLTVKRTLGNGDTTIWSTPRVQLLHEPFERIEFPNREDDQLVTSLTTGTVIVLDANGRVVLSHDLGGAEKSDAGVARNPNDIQQQTPEERMINQALNAVENLGAHPKLTLVSTLLSDAGRRLAVWHDAGRPGEADT